MIIWGKPGIGKTAAITHYAKRHGLHVEFLVAGLREPTDFIGFPRPTRGVTRWYAPDWAARLAEAGRPSILIFDEFTTARIETQNAMLRIVNERYVGDVKLPDDVGIVLIANPIDTGSGLWELPPTMANRLVHLQWPVPPADEWTQSLMTGFSQPPPTPLDKPFITTLLFGGRVKHVPADHNARGNTDAASDSVEVKARMMVAGFIRFKPTALFAFPENESNRCKPWPSPRSWHNAALGVESVLRNGGEVEDSFELVAGAVGEPMALEWVAWARGASSLITPEEVLENGGEWNPPSRADVAWTICAGVAELIASHPTEERAVAGIKALDKVPVDVAAVHAGRILRAMPSGWVPPKPAAALLRRYVDLFRVK